MSDHSSSSGSATAQGRARAILATILTLALVGATVAPAFAADATPTPDVTEAAPSVDLTDTARSTEPGGATGGAKMLDTAAGADMPAAEAVPEADTATSLETEAGEVSGAAVPGSPVSWVKVPPVVARVSVSTRFAVRWGATDPDPSDGIASYDVEYKTGGNGVWNQWLTGTTATYKPFYGRAGKTHFFRVRARDGAANLGDWSPEKYATCAFDDGSLKYRGTWRRIRSRYFYRGTTRFATRRGASASFTFANARSVGLVVTKRPTGGIATVYVNGRRAKTINLYYKRNSARVLIPIASYSVPMRGTVKVVVAGRKVRASKGTRVELDGMDVRVATRGVFGIASGINSIPRGDWRRGKSLRMIRDAGSRWVRAGAYWPWIDRNVTEASGTAGEFGDRDWSELDEWVEDAKAYDQEPIMVILGYAEWANGQPTHPYFVPPDTTEFINFTEDVVERYKDDIHYWEVWNEPNGPFWEVPRLVDGTWKWSHTPDPRAYARMLIPSYKVIKSEDPTARVVFGGIDRNHHTYLETAYSVIEADSGADANNNYFDILGVHPYCDNRPPESTDKRYAWKNMNRNFSGLPLMKQQMTAHGDKNKHIMITEMSWSLKDQSYTKGVSQKTQAAYLARAYRMVQRWPWVDCMLWYGFKNYRTGSDWEEDPFSIVNMNLTPRPAYYNYRTEGNR